MKIIPVVIPSHKRWDRVLSNKAIAGTIICVPDSQGSQYMEHNPETEVVTHPDSVVGIHAKRQWIINKWPTVFQVDDDIKSLSRMYLEKNDIRKLQVEPNAVRRLIDITADAARQIGAFLFGFNSTWDPRDYTGVKPFKCKGFAIGAGFGVLEGNGLYYSKEMWTDDDYFISLLNAHKNRFAWFDRRFAFITTATYRNAGGMSEFRTLEAEKQSYVHLREMFGEAVVPKKKPRPHKYSHPYEKTMQLPF